MNKRNFLKTSTVIGLSLWSSPSFAFEHFSQNAFEEFTLPNLPYEKNALEPHIDTQTMEIHHGKHHNGYVTNLNASIKNTPFATMNLAQILAKVKEPENAIRNNAGGHYNHSLFWTVLKPSGGGMPTGKLADAINATFGGFDKFKEVFSNAAKNRFGSGWAWLAMDKKGKLFVCSTPNQDNPLMTNLVREKGTPILGLDVWEHAYYLKYQNKRADYVEAFWNLVNWEEVAKRMNEIK